MGDASDFPTLSHLGGYECHPGPPLTTYQPHGKSSETVVPVIPGGTDRMTLTRGTRICIFMEGWLISGPVCADGGSMRLL